MDDNWEKMANDAIAALAKAAAHIEVLEARVAKLEAAKKPRPMSEAPRDGTPIDARTVAHGSITVRYNSHTNSFKDLWGREYGDGTLAWWWPCRRRLPNRIPDGWEGE